MAQRHPLDPLESGGDRFVLTGLALLAALAPLRGYIAFRIGAYRLS